MAIARLSNLSYWYPGAEEPALRDVSLLLDAGLTLVTGPSGGGKSTLLRVLNGLVPHFHGGRIAGVADVAGHDVITTPTRLLARVVGFVFQDPELQTVYDAVDREVAFGLENIALPPREMAARVEEALQAAGAGHLAGRSVRTLSGGERQRVALASALAMRPRLVVLDEPTSQLDPDGASMVLDAVQDLVEHGSVSTAWPAAPSLPAVHSTPSGGGPVAWSLTGVTAGFGGRVVLDSIDVAGHQGEVVALSGPNGGGKTTLLRLIAGAMSPTSGKVERRPGRIAYLPQNPTALLHRPTLRSEVSLTLERAGDSEPPEAILNELGLAAVAGRYPRDLSCGERQRAALAAVLPGRPDLVLLDEPTRGIDAEARVALVRLVSRLRDGGASVVLATHDPDLRAALADRELSVSGGKVLEAASRSVPV
jgi:energy-coupling factor transport system ATP-binding protein